MYCSVVRLGSTFLPWFLSTSPEQMNHCMQLIVLIVIPHSSPFPLFSSRFSWQALELLRFSTMYLNSPCVSLWDYEICCTQVSIQRAKLAIMFCSLRSAWQHKRSDCGVMAVPSSMQPPKPRPVSSAWQSAPRQTKVTEFIVVGTCKLYRSTTLQPIAQNK